MPYSQLSHKSYVNKTESEKMEHDEKKEINDELNMNKKIPFPKLSPSWYALQLSKEKLCYPRLSKKWFEKQSFDKPQHDPSISPNCNADQPDIPLNSEIPCSHKDDKTLRKTVEENTNSQIPYKGISKQ